MPHLRSLLKSDINVLHETNAILDKIAALYAKSPRHVVFEIGLARYRGQDVTGVTIDSTLGSGNVAFTTFDAVDHSYNTVQIFLIRRLRTKKWLIKFAS